METINIRLDRGVHKKLKIRAAKEEMGLSTLIDHLLSL